jgi:acyl-CoA synthetase (AMP-forming)/AMP-acid ligase II
VVAGGAPIAPGAVLTFRDALDPRAKLFATYGATEALPIASIESRELLEETAAATRDGRGTCVGRPVPGVELRIVRIADEPIARMADGIVERAGDVGEIAIRGPIVSPRYHGASDANVLHKIDDEGGAWHRTGDLGVVDESGRIWFCGRKSQRVTTARGTLFTVPWEGIFNAHHDVRRSALVGIGPRGAEEPVVCVEPRSREVDVAALERDLRAIAVARGLWLRAVLLHPAFPVDIRHNAKIGREALGAWAARRLARAPRATWLRAVPIAGWLFLVYGALFPLHGAALRSIWWIDLFLSVVVHAAQLVFAVPAGRRAGYSTAATVFFTFLFGATFWKSLEAPR